MTHDVANPDPLCLGDDPCVCEQLLAARLETLAAARAIVMKKYHDALCMCYGCALVYSLGVALDRLRRQL